MPQISVRVPWQKSCGVEESRKKTDNAAKGKSKRYGILDIIWGFALLNMILYHMLWDFVYLFDFNLPWYESGAGYFWQQGICCTFIFLSGFCQPLGNHKLKRALKVLFAGGIISAATILFMPENRVIFGVLTLIGVSMLLVLFLEPVLKPLLMRDRSLIGAGLSTAAFVLTKCVADGYIGMGSIRLWELPKGWYSNLATTFVGLPASDFYSADYFPLLPWFFLFLSGYFLSCFLRERDLMTFLESARLKTVEWFGRHSLEIYMIHQPVLYLILSIVF